MIRNESETLNQKLCTYNWEYVNLFDIHFGQTELASSNILLKRAPDVIGIDLNQ
jgi:hypothetical protein